MRCFGQRGEGFVVVVVVGLVWQRTISDGQQIEESRVAGAGLHRTCY